MADFNDHIDQAKKNIEFLQGINANLNDFWDWQVTCCFYIAVHLVNAHLAKKANLHYRSHEEVANAINPYNVLSITKLAEPVYLCYEKLRGLSRRSRYLTHEKAKQKDDEFYHPTVDKHLAKALYKLDEIMIYFEQEYKISFDVIEIDCIEIKTASLKYFKYKMKGAVSA